MLAKTAACSSEGVRRWLDAKTQDVQYKYAEPSCGNMIVRAAAGFFSGFSCRTGKHFKELKRAFATVVEVMSTPGVMLPLFVVRVGL